MNDRTGKLPGRFLLMTDGGTRAGQYRRDTTLR